MYRSDRKKLLNTATSMIPPEVQAALQQPVIQQNQLAQAQQSAFNPQQAAPVMNPESGLLGFGAGTPMLTQDTLQGLLSDYGKNSNDVYGQILPQNFKPYDPSNMDSKFDPYYQLRQYENLSNNPRFSWLNSFNMQPLNINTGPRQADIDALIQQAVADTYPQVVNDVDPYARSGSFSGGSS